MPELPKSLLGIPQGEAAKCLGRDRHGDPRYVGGFGKRIDPLFRCANKVREALLRSGSRAFKQGLCNQACISRIHRCVQSSLRYFAVPLRGLSVYLEFSGCPKHGNLSALTYVQIVLPGKLLNDWNSSSALRLVDESPCQQKVEPFDSRRLLI